MAREALTLEQLGPDTVRFPSSKNVYQVEADVAKKRLLVTLRSGDDQSRVLHKDRIDLDAHKQRQRFKAELCAELERWDELSLYDTSRIEEELQELSQWVAAKRQHADKRAALREPATKRLRVEPWPDPVEGKQLLDDVAQAFGRFVVAESLRILTKVRVRLELQRLCGAPHSRSSSNPRFGVQRRVIALLRRCRDESRPVPSPRRLFRFSWSSRTSILSPFANVALMASSWLSPGFIRRKVAALQ